MKTDPASLKRCQSEFRQYAQCVLLVLKKAFTGETTASAGDLSSLERDAVSDLRSWCDNRPIDDHYFHRYVRDVADMLYHDLTVDSTRLRLALTRSPLCCVYIGSYLFCRNVFRRFQEEV